MKVFWRFLDICVLNSWIVYRSNHPESSISRQKKFRLQLVKEVVQPLLDLKSSPSCPSHLHAVGSLPITQESCLIEKHYAYKSVKHKRCVVCSNKISSNTGKRCDKKTQNFCPKCQVFLCLGKCFETYHTQTSY